MMGETLNFFPANEEGFVERAGPISKIDAKDLEDVDRSRHLLAFKETMSQWHEFDKSVALNLDDKDLQNYVLALIDEICPTTTNEELEASMSRLRRTFKISPSRGMCGRMLTHLVNTNLVLESKYQRVERLQDFLVKRAVRTTSGVAVVTILTSPGKFSCPMDCYYCPNEPGQPRSYLSTEPAVLRGNQCGWDAATQFWDRASTLRKNGHTVDKIEVLVLGGTWSNYPEEYQREFVRDVFYAANTFPEVFDKGGLRQRKLDAVNDAQRSNTQTVVFPKLSAPPGMRPRKSLAEEIKINEKAEQGSCPIIGLTLETRPDFITVNELLRLREYGCTRVQIGIQHVDDGILEKINRGHTIDSARQAIRMLKNSGFKVDIHLMPDLPGSSPDRDLDMFDQCLQDPSLQADQWKIYPCSVTPYSVIERWYKEGSYMPYAEVDDQKLVDVILRVKRQMYPWIRLNRIVRDIPNQSIIAGNKKTNLRQLLKVAATKQNWKCKCMRCREVKAQAVRPCDAKLCVRAYDASGGKEFFISFESQDEDTLYGFCRLRLRQESALSEFEHSPFDVLSDKCALVRELHVYGKLVATQEKKSEGDSRAQHSGFGKKLLLVAEQLAIERGFERIAVIAGVGVRNYYRKFGYEEEETYMVKAIERVSTADRCRADSLIGLPITCQMFDIGNTPSVRTNILVRGTECSEAQYNNPKRAPSSTINKSKSEQTLTRVPSSGSMSERSSDDVLGIANFGEQESPSTIPGEVRTFWRNAATGVALTTLAAAIVSGTIYYLRTCRSRGSRG